MIPVELLSALGGEKGPIRVKRSQLTADKKYEVTPTSLHWQKFIKIIDYRLPWLIFLNPFIQYEKTLNE